MQIVDSRIAHEWVGAGYLNLDLHLYLITVTLNVSLHQYARRLKSS
jgi:hypothetical protein